MKILFLEDEPTIQEVLTEYMRMKEYEVICVQDGEEAINTLKSQSFDLAILDIMVPKISGLEVLEYIRHQNMELAVIMLTAIDDEATQLSAFNLYADDFVSKPVSPIILLKRIETIMRRVKQGVAVNSTEKREVHKDLWLSEKSYEAYYKEEKIMLTLSEFLLLQTLMREPGRVFTREQLILQIFNEDYIGNDRIIDAHVKNLRKKLPLNYVSTVIGVGYKFVWEVEDETNKENRTV